jgi:tetratricopeptide (TPR) repeat protein
VDAKVKQDFISNTKVSMTGAKGLGVEFANMFTRGAGYRFMRVHRVGVEQRALFRSKDKGFYIDCVLARDADGKVRICDFFVYTNGYLESEDLHQDFVVAAVRVKPAFINTLSPADHEYSAFDDAIHKMRDLISDKQYEQALSIYQMFPEVLKAHPRIIRDYLDLSCSAGKECDETIRVYREKCPNDSGVDQVTAPYYLVRRRLDDALACIDRLDKAVGGDPYLDADRASVYFLKGDLAAAKKCAQRAVALEPDNASVQEILKAVSLAGTTLPPSRPAKGVNQFEPSRGDPARDEEAKMFAEEFAKNVAANDMTAVNAAFDLAALYQRSTAGIDMSESTRTGVESAFSNFIAPAIADGFGLSSRLKNRRGSFRLLRLHHANGEQRALFRVITDTGAINYLDCTLVRHSDGKVRIDDFYNFAEGASFSEMMHRGLALGADKNASPDSASQGPQLGVVRMEMRKRISDGQFQAALDYFRGLPDKLKSEKTIMRTRIDAAQHLKGKPYDDAVRAYRQRFPDEPTTDLIPLDAYYEHKMYDRALACIDRVDSAIGGDPYLDALRSGMNRMKGDLDAAKSCAQKAIAAEPELRQPYFALIQVSLAEKDFTETSRLLTLVQKKFPDHMPSVKTNPVYAEYVKSPQYRAWAKAQKQ